MKSFSFAKALTLGCLVALTLPVACGDDDDTSTTKPGGTGGESAGGAPSADAGAGGAAPAIVIPGTSPESKTVKCGTAMCSSVKTIIPAVFVDPCCSGDGGDACGVDTQFFAILGASFKDTCQATAQVGPVDTGCPDSASQMLPVNGTLYSVPGFAGCCRAETGTCGVVVDSVAVEGIPLPFAAPKLGCVDSAPFFANKAGAACGAGTGGNGSGGAEPTAGGAANAGAGTVGGAGGNP
jgi:hypothetical protein